MLLEQKTEKNDIYPSEQISMTTQNIRIENLGLLEIELWEGFVAYFSGTDMIYKQCGTQKQRNNKNNNYVAYMCRHNETTKFVVIATKTMDATSNSAAMQVGGALIARAAIATRLTTKIVSLVTRTTLTHTAMAEVAVVVTQTPVDLVESRPVVADAQSTGQTDGRACSCSW